MFKIESSEQRSVRELLATELSISDDQARELMAEMREVITFPTLHIEIETPHSLINFVTVTHGQNGPIVRSRKLGNFQCNWRKLIGKICGILPDVAVGMTSGEFPVWSLAYKIIRIGLANSVVDFDPREAQIFYCLHRSGVLPIESSRALSAIEPELQRLGFPMVNEQQFQSILDQLVFYQTIRIEADRIFLNEEVISRN
ncbi:MAG: hypothetical protein WCO04_14185 [Pseudomonadota bacterium]